LLIFPSVASRTPLSSSRKASVTRNVVRLGRDRLTAILATPTPTQHRAFDLLGITPTA
jgi:hypothetical protein